MKTKVLLSSILTIALCLSLIAGSTFALFTSESSVGIVVTAGKVEMVADLTELELYSVQPNSNGTITDEFGGKYKYVECKNNTFANGGTATFENRVLTLDRVTPGDKVAFNIIGGNKSDVTIQYRYIIECEDGEKLMSGMLVTIGDTTYPVLSSYTSAWAELIPGEDIADVPVVIELPVTAGNEYQAKTAKIKVTVEAVQGNADVEGTVPVIEFLNGYTANLDKQIIDEAVIIDAESKNAIENGTIAVNNVGIENFGELTLTEVVVDGGTPGTIAYGYAFIGRGENSTTVMNDVVINSANGGIAAVGGAELVFNDGRVEVDSASTSARYLFYVYDEGSVVTINGGEFDFNKTQNQKRAYAYVGAGATLYITGGNFGTASSRSGYTDGLLGDGEIIISGGVFGFNPTKWLAPGHIAIKNGTQWYVVPENVDAIVKNSDELQDALNNATGAYVINVVGDIVGDVIAPQAEGVTVTINGNDHKFVGVLTVDGKSGTYLTAGLTINDFRFVAETVSADACIRLGDNQNINATRYTCNVTIQGCTFDVAGVVGVKSYTGGDKNVTIIDCVATEKAHSLAQLKGVDGVVVQECDVYAVRGINLNNSNNVLIIDSLFDVQKYAVRFGEDNNNVVEEYEINNCTLKSENVDGDAVIVLRAGATNANLKLVNTVIEGDIQMTGDENANITIS